MVIFNSQMLVITRGYGEGNPTIGPLIFQQFSIPFTKGMMLPPDMSFFENMVPPDPHIYIYLIT